MNCLLSIAFFYIPLYGYKHIPTKETNENNERKEQFVYGRHKVYTIGGYDQ